MSLYYSPSTLLRYKLQHCKTYKAKPQLSTAQNKYHEQNNEKSFPVKTYVLNKLLA